MAALREYGWVYLLLTIPALAGILPASQEEKPARYTIFLSIFLAVLTAELLYDFVLKVDFRLNWARDWRPSTSYLALYCTMNHGFVVMVWKTSLAGDLAVLGRFVLQMAGNVATHPRGKGQASRRQ